MIAAFPAAETVLVVLAGFPVSQAPVLRGMPYAPAQGRSVSPDRIGAPNSWVRSLDAHGGRFHRTQYCSTLNPWPVARWRLSIWPRQPQSRQTT
jgi:hypothetical protein